MKRINVLLAENQGVRREELRAILSAGGDIDVVGEAENGPQALELTRKLRPDVVVINIAMPLLNGLEATRQILKHRPATKVIILSAHSDDNEIDYVIHLGPKGYAIMQRSAAFLYSAIRETQAENRVCRPTVAARRNMGAANAPFHKGKFESNTSSQLTARQLKLVQWVAEGKANKQIAALFSISIKTVEKHRQHVMEKLDIHDTAGLTRYAIANRIIDIAYA